MARPRDTHNVRAELLKDEPAPPKRMTLSHVVERLTERGAKSSIGIKCSAQGQVQPDVNIVEGTTDEAIKTMTRQAIDAFVAIVAEANGGPAA